MARKSRPSKPKTTRTTVAAAAPALALPGWFRRVLVPVAAVVVLVALLYPGPMFQGHVFGAADTSASEAFRTVGDAARSETGYPFWNPYIFAGMPTFGSLAYTFGVYPPTFVFEFLHNKLGAPPLTWMLGHLILGGLGMWWLLGRWHLPWSARLLGCVSWLWFAKVVAWGVHGHGSKLGAAMALPWLLGLTWEVLGRGRTRAAGFAALVLGLQFLRGHVQISYYTLLLLGAVTVWSVVWPLEPGMKPAMSERWRRVGLMVMVVVAGFGIGAALLLPVHDYASISTRGAGGASGGGGSAYDYATAWSLAPEDLAAVVVPAAAGFGKATYMGRMPFTDYPNYLGLLLPLLAAAAWLSGRRSLVVGMAVVTGLSLALAMGRFSPGLYQLCYKVLPYFDKFRVPSMAIVIPALLVAMLAAVGASALASLTNDRAAKLRPAALGLLLVGGFMLVGGATGAVAESYRGALADLAGRSGKHAVPALLDAAWNLHRTLLIRQGLVLLVAGGALLFASRRLTFRQRWLIPVLAVIVAIDLGSVALHVTHPERSLTDVARASDGSGRLVAAIRLERPSRRSAVPQVPPGLAAVLQRRVGHDRLLPLGGLAVSNGFMTIGVRTLGGYYPAKPAVAEAVRKRLFDGVPSGRIAGWLAAAAVAYPGRLSADAFELLRQRGLDLDPEGEVVDGTAVYGVRNHLSRARLVDAWELAPVANPVDGLTPFLNAVDRGDRDPAKTVLLDREPNPLPQAGEEPLGTPEFVVDGLNEVVIRTEAPRPALLLLADTMAPGWQVTVDGDRVPLLTADLMLRAVALPAGTHDVRFTFTDPAIRRGLVLAAVGVILAAMMLAWPLGYRRGAALTASEEE